MVECKETLDARKAWRKALRSYWKPLTLEQKEAVEEFRLSQGHTLTEEEQRQIAADFAELQAEHQAGLRSEDEEYFIDEVIKTADPAGTAIPVRVNMADICSDKLSDSISQIVSELESRYHVPMDKSIAESYFKLERDHRIYRRGGRAAAQTEACPDYWKVGEVPIVLKVLPGAPQLQAPGVAVDWLPYLKKCEQIKFTKKEPYVPGVFGETKSSIGRLIKCFGAEEFWHSLVRGNTLAYLLNMKYSPHVQSYSNDPFGHTRLRHPRITEWTVHPGTFLDVNRMMVYLKTNRPYALVPLGCNYTPLAVLAYQTGPYVQAHPARFGSEKGR